MATPKKIKPLPPFKPGKTTPLKAAAPKKSQKVVNYPPKGVASVRFTPEGKKTTIYKSGKTVTTKKGR